jgi:hypothetical protein
LQTKDEKIEKYLNYFSKKWNLTFDLLNKT